MAPPLDGIRIIDFSTLLPGPLATLILQEAGAEVIKIERPVVGDEMRHNLPRFGSTSAEFALLNRGKSSFEADLKDEVDCRYVHDLIDSCDVLVEQFRPGVMDKLGFGYSDLVRRNPGLIYCSITGYGGTGPKKSVAGHDLNYVTDAGMLSLVRGPDGNPVMPPALIADVGCGAYPAVINILMALRQQAATGEGCHLDIAMAENAFTFMHWPLAHGLSSGLWPEPGEGKVVGGSPRYNLYQTQDGATLAVAALEDRFWDRLCDLLDLDPGRVGPDELRDEVARVISSQSASYWLSAFDGEDVCVSLVRTVSEATQDSHFLARGVFDMAVESDSGGASMPALPIPLDRKLRSSPPSLPFPRAHPISGNRQT